MDKPDQSVWRLAAPLGAAALLLSIGLLRRGNGARQSSDAQQAEQNRSRSIIEHASDAIISTDETQTILLANPSAAAMFCTTVKAMEGAPLDQFIPLPHMPDGSQPALHYTGENGIHLRSYGRRATDYAGTGRKASGEQFPLEGSISSLAEDSKRIYTIILRDITERKQVQEKLEQSYAQLRELSVALQTIREEERTHIARELHDDLGQLLATLRVDLSLLQQQPTSTPVAARLMRGMDELLLTTITSLRRIASNLRPRALDEGGLYFALQTLRQEFIHRHAIACELDAREAELTLDDRYSTAIFRIVQESLTNIARHAQADHVRLSLCKYDSHLLISIADDGRGISDADLDKSDSFGLLGMRERVRALRGEIDISANEPAGTRITIHLPLPAARQAS
ncbi:MAG: PAS domain-containing sensor histidine kinase [Pseudomonadota bacterium]